MAYASVKITANSSDYRTQMKSAATQMKELSSEYSVAATKARLFGSASDSLKAKAESLTQKITVQKNIVQMNKEQQERLTDQLGKQKTKQEELKTKVDAAKKAYEDEKKATGENSDASRALKEELDKLEQEFKDNETAIGKTETALSNQTVKTNRAETALMEMEAELEDVNNQLKNHKLNEFADACDKAGQKIEQFGKRMMVVSAGIATFATASAKMAVDFEDSIAKVSTIMDEGVMSVDEMEDAIINLSNETGIAAGDIADNVYNAISAGQDTADAVNFVRESTKLATAGFAESGDTLDILTTILNAYGLEAEKVTEVSDMLVQTQNLGKTTVSELSSAMGKVIPTANANSVALDQLCAGYAIMTAKGVATAETTTYMNSMLNELGKTGSTTDVILREKTGKSFSELMQSGSSLADVLQIIDGAAKEENITMSDMFSSAEAAKAGLILLGDSADSFNGTLEGMRQSTGATDSAFEKMQTTSYDIKIAMNELKNTVLQFGQVIMSSAAPLVEQFTEKVHTLCEWFSSLDEGQQQTILKIGLFTAAVGPATIGIGKFAQGISSTIKTGQQLASGISTIIAKITGKTAATAAATTAETAATAATAAQTTATVAQTTATTAATGATTALGTAMKLLKGVGIVAVILAIVEAGVWLYKNWDMVKEKAAELWAKIKEIFGKIKEAITGAFTKAKETVVNKVNEIKDAVVNSSIGQAASKAFNGVKNTVSKVMTAAVDTAKEKLNNMKTAYEENGGGIKGVVAAGWEGIKGFYTTGFSFIDNLTGGKLTAIKEKFSSKLGEVKAVFSDVFEKCKEVVSNVFNTIKNVVTVSFMTIREIVNAAVEIITIPFRFIWENCKGIVINVWEAIKEKIQTAVHTVETVISTVMNAIKETLQSIWDAVASSVSTVWEGIKTTISTVVNTINTIVITAMNAIKETLQRIWDSIASVVLAVWDGIKNTITTIVDGIKSKVTSVFEGIKTTATSVWNGVKSVITTSIDTAKSALSGTLNGMKSIVSSVFDGIKSTVSSTWNAIKNAITTPINAAKTAVGDAISAIRGAFNFSWSLPKLKLPHPKISGSFSLNPPSVPHFSIEWYKTGGIMTNPTVFGVNGTKLMVGGEAGAEAILPLQEFYNRLTSILDEKIGKFQTAQGVTVYVHNEIDGDEVAARTTTRVVRKITDQERDKKIFKGE